MDGAKHTQQQYQDKMCVYPRLIINKKYKPNKKNGGQPQIMKDPREKFVPVGCGDCFECKKQKTREWQVRLSEECRIEEPRKMCTLTFSTESLNHIKKQIKEPIKGYELDNAIATWAVRHFLERWRKKYKKSLKHWLVTELGQGETEHIHLHGIVWTNDIEEVNKIWGYGYGQWKGRNYVNEQTVNYIVKYIKKIDIKHLNYKPKILTSPGIGGGYIKRKDSEKNKYKYNGETNESYKTRTGHTLSLPIYYRNKIYTEQERTKLWIKKLDKNERWVGGEKIDVSENEEEYNKRLKFYQEKNKRLGYPSPQEKWEAKKYEEQRREIIHNKRFAPQAGDCPPVGREHETKTTIRPSKEW